LERRLKYEFKANQAGTKAKGKTAAQYMAAT
jgi:hypothetical protein